MTGDLIARLRWLAEYDRDTLLVVLAAVDTDVLREALATAMDARQEPARG